MRPILISGDDAAFWYDKPRILHAGGRIVLHVPADESGTGNFNRELLYVWANGAWHDVDVTSWHAARPAAQGPGHFEGVIPTTRR